MSLISNTCMDLGRAMPRAARFEARERREKPSELATFYDDPERGSI